MTLNPSMRRVFSGFGKQLVRALLLDRKEGHEESSFLPTLAHGGEVEVSIN